MLVHLEFNVKTLEADIMPDSDGFVEINSQNTHNLRSEKKKLVFTPPPQEHDYG